MCRQNSGVSAELLSALVSHGADLSACDEMNDSARDLLDYNEAATSELRMFITKDRERTVNDNDVSRTAAQMYRMP